MLRKQQEEKLVSAFDLRPYQLAVRLCLDQAAAPLSDQPDINLRDKGMCHTY
jgi:hypothetical protein